jgi:hypothetical protein
MRVLFAESNKDRRKNNQTKSLPIPNKMARVPLSSDHTMKEFPDAGEAGWTNLLEARAQQVEAGATLVPPATLQSGTSSGIAPGRLSQLEESSNRTLMAVQKQGEQVATALQAMTETLGVIAGQVQNSATVVAQASQATSGVEQVNLMQALGREVQALPQQVANGQAARDQQQSQMFREMMEQQSKSFQDMMVMQQHSSQTALHTLGENMMQNMNNQQVMMTQMLEKTATPRRGPTVKNLLSPDPVAYELGQEDVGKMQSKDDEGHKSAKLKTHGRVQTHRHLSHILQTL